MMNLSGSDLLGNCLINTNTNLTNNINNTDANSTQINIDTFKNMLNVLSLDKTINDNILDKKNLSLTYENCEDIDISKLASEDIFILDVDENNEFFNAISSMIEVLDNTKLNNLDLNSNTTDNAKLIIKDLLDIIEKSKSSDELEEAMSKLLSELTVPAISMDNLIVKEDSFISNGTDINAEVGLDTNANIDIEMMTNNNSRVSYVNEELSTLDITSKNDNMDKFINYLKNSSESLTDNDITTILNKLNSLYTEDTANEKLNSNKKKEVKVPLDNFNIDIAHNKAINLHGVEFSEEIQGASSKILEKLTTAIQEKISSSSLDDATINIRLKLYPRNLGELTIDILNHEGKMNIKIFSENTSIKDYLSSSMNELISSLNSKNLAIEDIEVLLSGNTQSSFDNNSNSSNNSNNHNSSQNLNKVTNYINNDVSDEVVSNFESSDMSERNLNVNI